MPICLKTKGEIAQSNDGKKIPSTLCCITILTFEFKMTGLYVHVYVWIGNGSQVKFSLK